MSHKELEYRIREIHQKLKIPPEKVGKVALLRSLSYKRLVNPEFVRETISCSASKDKTLPQVFHGEHFASVDKFDQYLSYASSSVIIRKKMVRLFRWVVEAAMVQTHSLLAEARYERGTRPASLVSILLGSWRSSTESRRCFVRRCMLNEH